MAGGLQRTLNGCQGEQIKQPLENRLSLIQVRDNIVLYAYTATFNICFSVVAKKSAHRTYIHSLTNDYRIPLVHAY